MQLLEDLLQKQRPNHIQPPAGDKDDTDSPSSRSATHASAGHGTVSVDRARDKRPDRGESSPALLSQAGTLSLRASGADPHYFGASSMFSFSRMLHSCVRQNAHEILGGSGPSMTGTNELAVSPCLLPPFEVAVKLSDAYFESVHLQYPFLHEPTFRNWELLAHGLESRPATPVELFFVNAVSNEKSFCCREGQVV